MPLDKSYELIPGGLADRARAAAAASYPPHAKRGGSLRQATPEQAEIPENKGVGGGAETSLSDVVAQTTPPPRDRSKRTTTDMEAFASEWVFDWLAITIPNGLDGKGSRRPGDEGEQEAAEAEARLFTWATLRGLRLMRVGKGADGYLGAAHLAFDPTASERVVSIRGGHASNMPSMELVGAQGACADLAPRALNELGPVNVSRVDVCWDVSQQGLVDELHAAMIELAAERGMDAPRVDGTAERGRTIYLGRDEAVVRVYQKDLERIAKGHLPAAEADPDLVRIEVMLRPKKGAKAGIGRTAREKGPGALLGVHLWVRQLMERVAVLTHRARVETAQMGVTRVRSRPDPRSIRERAQHGTQQYARTFCLAEVADLVEIDWEGDWLTARIDPDLVVDRAVNRIRRHLKGVVGDVCDRAGVLEARDIEAEADRARGLLDRWMSEQTEATRLAQERLAAAAELARERCGVQMEVAA